MEKLGFILVTFLLFIFLLGVIEKKGWRYAGFFSVATFLLGDRPALVLLSADAEPFSGG